MNRKELYELAKVTAPKLLETNGVPQLEAAIAAAAAEGGVDSLDRNEFKRYVLAERQTLKQLERAPLPSEAAKLMEAERAKAKLRAAPKPKAPTPPTPSDPAPAESEP
jgi:hypothetical protein